MKLLLALTVLLTSGLANAVTLDDELIQKAKEGARNFGKNLLKHKFPPEDLVNVTNRELQGSDFTSFPILAEFFGGEPGFYHSVASGSPLEDGIILWTRYTPRAATDVVVIEYRMAKVDPGLPFEAHLDPLANPDLLRGTVLTDGSIDWVVKLDVRGLDSYTDYVFAFVAEGKVSDVGQTRTAPSMGDNVEKLRYAVFSCSNYPSAYFHSYDLASTIRNLDLWFHVGDYFYEYAAGNANERQASILPRWEIVSLADYRQRHSTYVLDEGLSNLRRRAPVMTTWDDHEIANNDYGDGTIENSGAQNHQPVCEVGDNNCVRDEGPVKDRFTAATQAYLEWMPIRPVGGPMGIVDIANIAQTVEWGDLATFVSVDTRISGRTSEQTLSERTMGAPGDPFEIFTPFAIANTDISTYGDSQELRKVNEGYLEILNDSSLSQITDDSFDFVIEKFAESKAAGKPWQVFAASTVMGPETLPDFSKFHEFAPTPEGQAIVKGLIDAVAPSPLGVQLRVASAMGVVKAPINRDDWNGVAVQRRELLSAFMQKTNFPIVLGGDVHDSFAFTLFESGFEEGDPVGINIVCPGVGSRGQQSAFNAVLGGVIEDIGGVDAYRYLLNASFADTMSGLKYFDLQYRGFFAAEVTHEKHVTEYFHFTDETSQQNYLEARAASGKIVADYICGTSMVSTASERGSLVPQDSCGAITFDSSRPAVWDLPVPIVDDMDGLPLADCGIFGCRVEKAAPEPAPTPRPTGFVAPPPFPPRPRPAAKKGSMGMMSSVRRM